MEIDTDKLIENALRDGLREGVKAKLSSSYNNPVDKMIEQAITARNDEFRKLLDDALGSCLKEKQFRDDVKAGVRHTLAKTLIARFGGELEKQVNVLKSDPATRARITLAIDQIVKERSELPA